MSTRPEIEDTQSVIESCEESSHKDYCGAFVRLEKMQQRNSAIEEAISLGVHDLIDEVARNVWYIGDFVLYPLCNKWRKSGKARYYRVSSVTAFFEKYYFPSQPKAHV